MTQNFTDVEPIEFLTHVMKHVVNSQPRELSQCTKADNDAMDIITSCKQLIRAEQDLLMFRLRKF